MQWRYFRSQKSVMGLAVLYPMGGLKVKVAWTLLLLFRICKYKVLKYIQSEVTGFQSKAYQAASRM